jgi:hypothetical protein
MAITIDPMRGRNLWRKRALEARQRPPPRPIQTLAEMPPEKQEELRRLYQGGPKRRPVGPR